MTKRVGLGAAAALMLWIYPAMGQEFVHGLKQVTDVTLSVELSKDAAACGITDQLIKSAFMFPVSGTPLRVEAFDRTKTQIGASFEILVLSMHNQWGICFSSYTFILRDGTSLKSLDGKQIIYVDNLLWHDFRAISSMVAEHPRQLRDAIESLTKDFITSWNMARKEVTITKP